jgi:riboflavin kinase/FMN adenylyltransferase
MIELDINAKYTGCVVMALGFFDSLHRGHRRIIDKLKKLSDRYGCQSAVMTFENNPYPALKKDVKLIYTYAERTFLLEKLGVGIILKCDFTEEFKNMTEPEFAGKLSGNFNVKRLLCGYDFKFGKYGKGDAAYLKDYFEKRGVKVDIIPQVNYRGSRVSSTAVREYLSRGEIKKANTLLARPYFVSGTVVKGDGRGAKTLFPTINVMPDAQKIRVKEGVYLTAAEVGGRIYCGVTNCGGKPTFGINDYRTETHILDFNGDLYGKSVRIYFLERLRGIKKYSGAEALKARIQKDILKARNIFNGKYKNITEEL